MKLPTDIEDKYLKEVLLNLSIDDLSNEEWKVIEGFENLLWHEIKFQNYGIGIPETEVEDIFLLYRRGSNAHKVRPSGSGIGLYLVDQIIRAHKGICKV